MPYRIIHVLNDQQIDQLVALFRPEWWTSHRTREGVVEMLKHSSIVFGAIDAEDNLVGFMRLLTDFVYRGTLYDVIVREDLRGEGVSRFLLEAVLNHPRCRSIESIDLMCKPEKEGLYAKLGWETTRGAILTMRRKGEVGMR
jgi:GNAT superfamily N-acetyltransferase